MFAPRTEISNENKTAILIAVLQGYEEHLLYLANSSLTTTATVGTGLIGLPVLLGDKLKSLPAIPTAAISVVLVLMAVMAVWSVVTNAKHYNWLCRAITRVKQAMGLFEEGLFIDRKRFETKNYEHWIESDSILPTESQDWGASFKFTAVSAYILTLLAALMCSLVILWYPHL